MEKYIHYCWFGNSKKPRLAKKCIKSWKKYLPDYEIVEWNENNFDVNITKFSKKAYQEKKWAFVSDVARVYALKQMGGIYFDTDMMITKKIDKSILDSNFFVGWESDINIAVGVMGANKGNKIIEKLFATYKKEEFDPNDLYRMTIPRLLTNLLKKEYNMKTKCRENQMLSDKTVIYARDYFYPISSDKNIPDMFTENTCMIHYYSGSWLPRNMQLKLKFERVFGKKLGRAILKLLVLGKHFLIDIKRILKRICKIVLYPLVRLRRKRYNMNLINKQKQQFNKSIERIKTEHVVFYREGWLGVANSTQQLFGESSVGITDYYYDEVIEHCANRIIEKGISFVAFSGFCEGWDKLITRLNEKNSHIVIKVIWHGSMCMNIYDYDYIMFTTILKLLKEKYIKTIGFVKKSMYEFFKEKGYNVQFIANGVTLSEEIKNKIKQKNEQNIKEKDNRIKIGIYASGDRWVKNFYNQMAAASLVENCIVDCLPLNYKVHEIADAINLEIKGLSTQVNHEKLLERMAKNDINLYVTFSECAPIIPLESLELGVPCITGDNHHFFECNELEQYLVVDKADNINEIYQGIKRCLDNKEEIINKYKIWRENNIRESQKSVEEFLSL